MCHLSLNPLTSKINRCRAKIRMLDMWIGSKAEMATWLLWTGFGLAAFVALTLGGFFTSKCSLQYYPSLVCLQSTTTETIVWQG